MGRDDPKWIGHCSATAPFPCPPACLPWQEHGARWSPQVLAALAFKEAFHAILGFDAAGLAPTEELGQVHATVSRLAVVNPGLGLAHAFAQLPLGKISFRPHGSQERRQRPITKIVLGFGRHPFTMAWRGRDTIPCQDGLLPDQAERYNASTLRTRRTTLIDGERASPLLALGVFTGGREMRKHLVEGLLASLVVLEAAVLPSYGGWNWTPLDYPGAKDTTAYGIEGDNIVGGFHSSMGFGFVYNNGSWQRAAYSGYETVFYGIHNRRVVGAYGVPGQSADGFSWYTDSHTFSLDYANRSPYGISAGAASGTVVTGTQWSQGVAHGWYATASTYYYYPVDKPGASYTHFRGVSGNKIVGYYGDTTGQHALVYDLNSQSWTTLNYPGATSTIANGINGNIIVGQYKDSSNHAHGFMYDGNTWTPLDFPGATNTSAFGISGDKIVCGYTLAYGSIGGGRLPRIRAEPSRAHYTLIACRRRGFYRATASG